MSALFNCAECGHGMGEFTCSECRHKMEDAYRNGDGPGFGVIQSASIGLWGECCHVCKKQHTPNECYASDRDGRYHQSFAARPGWCFVFITKHQHLERRGDALEAEK